MEISGKKIESGVIKWERFLPRMALRVLLIEPDDSTRQIISVLLRKCSYKVASVADGLKAWDILKARPDEIDLILTEVDLPAISGSALLTLIMEHETCKNIPVIMMSSQDSVSTVYSCMLRGAADYLVKPIRRNELRNLWQHVWRRQSTNIESDAQQEVEGTCENNAACNDSSSYTASVQGNKERVDRGSDAQSSCTGAETENDHAKYMKDFAESKEGKSFSGGSKQLNNEAYADIEQGCEAGSVGDSPKDANSTAHNNVESEIQRRDANIARDNNSDALINSSCEAIDLIGAFNTYQNCSDKNGSTASKFDSSPQLDLSLKRSHPSDFEFQNQVTEKGHTINHSDASAFTRYTNRPLKRIHPTPDSDYNQQNEYGVDTCSPMSMAACLSDKLVLPLSVSPQKVYPVPVPVREIKFNKIFTSYSHVVPSTLTLSPSSANNHQGSTFHPSYFHQSNVGNNNSGPLFDQLRQNVNNHSNQNKRELESLEDCRHNPDQSASSSFCNGTATYHNNISNVDQAIAPESKIEGGNSHRSLQREAALTKFRLKRKERCYDKKVRYESRKKLAEQRPRVKGQFVRQAQSDVTPAVESDNHTSNSAQWSLKIC